MSVLPHPDLHYTCVRATLDCVYSDLPPAAQREVVVQVATVLLRLLSDYPTKLPHAQPNEYSSLQKQSVESRGVGLLEAKKALRDFHCAYLVLRVAWVQVVVGAEQLWYGYRHRIYGRRGWTLVYLDYHGAPFIYRDPSSEGCTCCALSLSLFLFSLPFLACLSSQRLITIRLKHLCP